MKYGIPSNITIKEVHSGNEYWVELCQDEQVVAVSFADGDNTYNWEQLKELLNKLQAERKKKALEEIGTSGLK